MNSLAWQSVPYVTWSLSIPPSSPLTPSFLCLLANVSCAPPAQHICPPSPAGHSHLSSLSSGHHLFKPFTESLPPTVAPLCPACICATVPLTRMALRGSHVAFPPGSRAPWWQGPDLMHRDSMPGAWCLVPAQQMFIDRRNEGTDEPS